MNLTEIIGIILGILSLVGFILVHSVLVAHYAGKITNQIQNLIQQIQEWREFINRGGFPHCKGHEQKLNSFEKRLEHVELRLEQQ